MSLSKSLIATIRDSEALSLAAEIGELGVDAIVSGPAKEIPVLGSIVGLWRAGAQARDMVFVAKLRKFLSALAFVPAEEREKFGLKIEQEPEFANRVGEGLLLVLEQLDDTAKAPLLAQAFAAYVREEISYDLYCEFALAINRCLLLDLVYLPETPSRFQLPASVATRLSACGLIEVHGIATIRKEGDEANYYQVTSLGKEFKKRLSLPVAGSGV